MKYLLFFIVLSTFVSCGENQFEFTSCSKGYIYEGNGITCIEIFCGNNIVSSNEECDKNDLSKNSCITLGYSNGILKCNNDCTFLKEDCRITEQSGTIKRK